MDNQQATNGGEGFWSWLERDSGALTTEPESSLEQLAADFRADHLLNKRFLPLLELLDQIPVSDDLRQLVQLMLLDLRDDSAPLYSGKSNGWLAGVLMAIRRINGIGPKGSDWFPADEAVRARLKIAKNTMERRGREVLELLAHLHLAPRYLLAGVLRDSPVYWTQATPDGRLVDLRTLPRELQEEAYKAGVIPYVPAHFPEGLLPLDMMLELRTAPPGEDDEQGEEKPLLAPLNRVYTLHITLGEGELAVERRLEVLDTDFSTLHEIIQAAFGWMNYHLWEFEIGRGRRIGEPADDDYFGYDEALEPADELLLSDLLGNRPKKRFTYTYDFGDCWEHRVVVERVGEPEPGVVYPRCTGGEGITPPEDCGGFYRYEEIFEIVRNPEDPEHEEFREYYPELLQRRGRVNLKTINRRLKPFARKPA